jgi:MFS family permease
MIFTMYAKRPPPNPASSHSSHLPSLDIGPVVWQIYNEELGITYNELNDTFAANCAGLAVGCIIFIPFAIKYGRRPVYIIAFAMAVWQAKLNTFGEMLATQVISGLSGVVSETLVQMTVS